MLNNEIICEFTKWLPVLRKIANTSQEHIAESIGVSRQTYSSIETGSKVLDKRTFFALLCYFLLCDKTQKIVKSKKGFIECVKQMM